MAENKDIADYYLELYRKIIRISNIVLGIALIVLIVNWIFAVEPGFESINHARKQYKSQLRKAQKELINYSNIYSWYHNRYYADSLKNISNIGRANILREMIDKR